MAGILGGVVAMAGMFFPTAWIMVWVSGYAQRFKNSGWWHHTMAMIRPCVAAMILYAGAALWMEQMPGAGWMDYSFFVGAFSFLHFTKWSSAWMMALALLLSVLPL